MSLKTRTAWTFVTAARGGRHYFWYMNMITDNSLSNKNFMSNNAIYVFYLFLEKSEIRNTLISSF